MITMTTISGLFYSRILNGILSAAYAHDLNLLKDTSLKKQIGVRRFEITKREYEE